MSRFTYSTPVVHRSKTDSVIEFDIHSTEGAGTSWEALRVGVVDERWRGVNAGDIVISARGEGQVVLPREVMPVVLAEIDRLMSGDDVAPFEPISASRHVAEAAPITGLVPTAVSL